MKKVLIVLTVVAFMSCQRATDQINVPEPVQTSFNKKYPEAKAIEWEVQHDKYIAKFEKDGAEIEVEFIADGTFLKEEIDNKNTK